MQRSFFSIVLMFLIAGYSSAQEIVINEIMSANTSTLTDSDGEYPDWIELLNNDSAAIRIDSLFLSDNRGQLQFSQLPPVVLQPGEFYLVYAADGIGERYTNFKIKSSGETVYLSDFSGAIRDSMAAPMLPADVSYGRSPDGSANLLYFHQPTPAATNAISGSKKLNFDLPRPAFPAGNYSGSISLSLLSTLADTIYFTLDGSKPSTHSPVYSSPLILEKTTVVRARSLVDGIMSERTMTATYILSGQSNLPNISIAALPADLWDDSTGIYTNWQNGREIPIHLEFFESGSPAGFSIGAGMRIFGGWSRHFPQKSLAIFARKKYGSTKVEYPVFPDMEVDEFESFVLRNAGGNFGASHFRDPLMHRLAANLDIETQAYRPAVVYLNGTYWGIMNMREKINEHYLESHFSVAPDNLDMLENDAEILHGDNSHFLALQAYLRTQDMTLSQSYDYLKTQIDIDNYLDYLTAEIYYTNVDWPGWNLKFWRPQTPQGKWRWIIFDLDDGFGWGKPQDYGYRNMFDFATTTNGDEWPNPPWSTFMLRSLLQNEPFKQDLLNRFADNLNTVWRVDHVLSTIDSLQFTIAAEMPHHIERWKGEFNDWQMSMEQWQESVESLREFGRTRPENLLQTILSEFNLPQVTDLIIKLDPVAGRVRVNHHLEIADSSWQGQYFSGIPVSLAAEANPGYVFQSWSGDAISASPEIGLEFSGRATLTAHFIPDNSPVPAIVINEINYHSSDEYPAGDWFELVNNSPDTVNIAGWHFRDENPAHRLFFPSGTRMPPKSFTVVCRDTAAFSQIFPTTEIVPVQLNFGLSNKGEILQLFDEKSRLVDSLHYSDDDPWPVTADGFGPTLSLKNPDLDNADPGNWLASSGPGTPGSLNKFPTSHVAGEQISTFALWQNYPNPFQKATTISFQLPENAQVELGIYNLLGQEISILAQGKMVAGIYKMRWQPAPEIARGLYLIRLRVDKKVAVRKMIYF